MNKRLLLHLSARPCCRLLVPLPLTLGRGETRGKRLTPVLGVADGLGLREEVREFTGLETGVARVTFPCDVQPDYHFLAANTT
jgi:hypothetical protein